MELEVFAAIMASDPSGKSPRLVNSNSADRVDLKDEGDAPGEMSLGWKVSDNSLRLTLEEPEVIKGLMNGEDRVN